MITKTKESLSRRQAFKLTALSAVAAAFINPLELKASTKVSTNKKIVIVGGGSGAIAILSRLLNSIENPDITIIAPNETHIYQPGQIYVAAGVYENSEIFKKNSDYIPDSVKWVKDKVTVFHPDENFVITKHSEKITYDYLIVSTGLEYKYEWIKGLKQEDIGTRQISSVYLNDTDKGTAKGGVITNEWFKALKTASKDKKQKVLYTMPNTPVKCGAVAQQMLYLSADYLAKEGLNAEFIYTPNGKRLFGLKPIDERLHEAQKKYPTLTNKFQHNLIEIDIEKKIATYRHNYEVKSGWDEDFEEWENIEKKTEIIKINYDFIHIVPPMAATDAVANSKLAIADGHYKGWLYVDRDTLLHNVYKNVFGIGDICGIPLGKTIPTLTHQAVTLEANLLSLIANEKVKNNFNGYSVCPIKVAYESVILAEFDYEGIVRSSYAKRSSYKWWLFDLRKTKSEYWSSTLKGRV